MSDVTVLIEGRLEVSSRNESWLSSLWQGSLQRKKGLKWFSTVNVSTLHVLSQCLIKERKCACFTSEEKTHKTIWIGEFLRDGSVTFKLICFARSLTKER